ncbi:hypothetical protein CARN8_3410007 [mine drainage metagenome]|uniref:Uncharacterized protein n=1 Tax=mine drainage metagenome TaxID=410659 RepID=A0A3P3ZP38_9ZZZZ
MLYDNIKQQFLITMRLGISERTAVS